MICLEKGLKSFHPIRVAGIGNVFKSVKRGGMFIFLWM